MINIKDIQYFSKWLQDRGCEILPTTNEYEVLRFRGKETGVFYTSGKTSNKYANNAYIAFKSNKKWDGGPVSVGRCSSYKKEKQILLVRDGFDCFLCGKPLGEDITIEHLIALSSGGKNVLANMVLMHQKCNSEVGNKPISEKVKMAILKRIQLNNF
jgi:hypothetical protein